MEYWNIESYNQLQLYLDIHIRTEVDVDQRVEYSVDSHQFLPSGRPQVLLGLQEVSDESSLGVLPLCLGDHVTAVEHLDVGESGHQHRPLLLPVKLVKERAALDPEIIESWEPPELLDLLPAADLGGGDIEAHEAGGDVVQILHSREISHRTLRQTEELNPTIETESGAGGPVMYDLPWTLGEESEGHSAEVCDRIAGEEKLFQILVLQHQVAGVPKIVGTQMELVKLDQLLHQEDDG